MKKRLKKQASVLFAIALVLNLGFVSTVNAAESKVIKLEEDWRLTNALDIDAGNGNTVIIDGQNKYSIYEMDAVSKITNTTGTVALKDVDIVCYGSVPTAGTLAELQTAAEGVKNITAPAADATTIALPTAGTTAGAFAVSISSSSNVSVISTSGVVTPPSSATTVNLVLSVAGNHGIAYTDPITVIVPSKSSSGSIGGGGGGGSGTSPTTPDTPAATTDKTKGTVTSTTTAKAEEDAASGKAKAAVPADAAAKLLGEAKTSEAAGQNSILEIKVETQTQAKGAEVSIPRNAFNEIASATNAEVKVNTGIGTVSFDAAAVASISEAVGTGDISISIEKVEKTILNEEQKKIVGERPVYDFSVSAGTTKVSNFGGGEVHVSVPYTLAAGESPESIVVYYVDDSGSLQTVRGSYDKASGAVSFVTKHFSKYMVGYNKISFSDVADTDWYSNAVGFIAARGITTGTGNGLFGADTTLTRGQFLVMLMKAYGIAPATTSSDNFKDAGNSYYTSYLAAAKTLGITKGIGNDLYAPEFQITRQDMFTLLYRSLEAIGELPAATAKTNISDFNDKTTVAAYAVTPMNTFLAAGIIKGDNNTLDPKGISNRAQMAQVLYKLLKNP